MHDDEEDEGPWIAGSTLGIPRWFIVVAGGLVLLSWIVPGPTDGDVDPATVSTCSDWVSALNAVSGGEQTDALIVERLRAVEAEAATSDSADIRAAAEAAHASFAAGDVAAFEAASADFTQACEDALAGRG
jgi:hypothetical protein